jgi:carboxylesterase type B
MQFFQSIVILLFLTTDALTEVVNTTYGPVEGKTTQIDDGTFVNSWYGVPYAAPPIGNLRFEVGC